jgi:asparagine synthase (glutamine-hydrolysing)
MCGIAGYMVQEGAPDTGPMDRMLETLAHRGPDGRAKASVGGASLGHVRLAIIDLETGDQPFVSQHGTVLIANGEIYNFIELRDALGGEKFSTNSDCEPPLRLFDLNGNGYAEQLRGMYAIAIIEAGGENLHLSRDPFGIKPLYYTPVARGIAFASEPQALIKAGFITPEIRPESRHDLLQHQFTRGAETIYRGISRVLPGETLSVSAGGIARTALKPALPDSAPTDWTEDEALKRLDEAFMDSVAIHQRSDVPYGMFLSGGVDSSAVLAAMRDLNETPVECFTAGFSGTDATDEREHAERVAKAAGARHHSVDFSEDDFWALLPRIAEILDDPTADYATLPTYLLGGLTAEHGLKVILSGEGGDELFAGYGRYRRLLRPRLLGGRDMRRNGLFEGLGILRDEASPPPIPAPASQNWTKLQTAQALDCQDWLPNDLLIKLDRCLMAHSVEGRTPFLDPAVADVAMRLPNNLKIRSGLGKYLLRKWLEQKLPEADPFAKKRGFTVPVAEWIGRQAKQAGELVAAQDAIDEIAEPDKVRALFNSLEGSPARHAGQAAWRLLFYALWHRANIQGKAPIGDVFETLSAG